MRTKAKRSPLGFLLLALAALIGLPIFLIAAALFEQEVIGTRYSTELYRTLGILDPLDWLFDNTLGRIF